MLYMLYTDTTGRASSNFPGGNALYQQIFSFTMLLIAKFSDMCCVLKIQYFRQVWRNSMEPDLLLIIPPLIPIMRLWEVLPAILLHLM